MTIKHLVISSGAYKGFYMLGALEYLQDKNFINLNNLESIYATSVGAMFGLCICLGIELKELKQFVIKKEWEKYFDFSINMVLNIIQKKGLLDKQFMKSIYKSLFRKTGLSIDATLKEIYNHSHIDLNIFSTNMTSFTTEQISHKTHPDMKAIDAVYMSSAIPFIFQPEILNNCCYIDGGMVNPYPLNICLNDLKKINPDIDYKEILGLKLLHDELENIKPDSSIFYMGLFLIYKLLDKNYDYKINSVLNYELIIPPNDIPLSDIKKILENENERLNLVIAGKQYGKLFLEYLNKSN